MSNRAYRFIIGLSLLLTLYLDLQYVMWGIITIILLEGITNYRIPVIINLIRKTESTEDAAEGCIGITFEKKINFDSERAWRLMVGSLLLLSYVIFPDALWFFTWFMAIAIFGAGVSGVCPMFLMLKWLGFR
ncbi:MAG: DUF2892 domain-containing protein [Gammaproteobacteria bacterium]|nr:DUF2892 domain-containing protein [Gammaproteobacteria bacterium]